MRIYQLYTYCREVIDKYPALRDDVMRHFALAEMECEDDASSEGYAPICFKQYSLTPLITLIFISFL